MKKDTKINLCDECKLEFAECKSNPMFGNGYGNDNVYQCDKYEAPQPLVIVDEELLKRIR
jgi:hypothetical protein